MWPADPDVSGPPYWGLNGYLLGQLTDQINTAQSLGKRVILTVNYRFPPWLNKPPPNPPPSVINGEKDYLPTDADVAIGGKWYEIIDFFIAYYSYWNPNKVLPNAFINMLEIVNEPNVQAVPRSGEDLPRKVARMMASARHSNDLRGNGMLLGGPALADIANNCQPYAFEIVQWLSSNGFNNGNTRFFVWTHHNYEDMEQNRTANFDSGYVWATVFQNGFRGSSELWITEGGARADVVGGENAQAARWHTSWGQMKNAPGIAMVTNYLAYTVPTYDTGIVRQYQPGQAPAVRPSWHAFKSFASAV